MLNNAYRADIWFLDGNSRRMIEYACMRPEVSGLVFYLADGSKVIINPDAIVSIDITPLPVAGHDA